MRNLLIGNTYWSVQGHSDTGEQCGQEVALIALHTSQESTGFESSTAFACKNERKVVPSVLIAVLQARTPHHNTVVEQSTLAFLEAMHLFHHISLLVHIELVDRRHFANFFLIIAVMCLGVVLVGESKFGVGGTVRTGTDVGADTRGVGLKSEND